MSEPEIREQVAEAETPQTMSQDESADAVEDAILDRLFADEDETSVSPSATKNIEAKSEPSPAPANPVREKAVAVLKRDGVPQSIIDSASDEVLAEWVAKASKRQADVDAYGSKMKELEKKVSASRKTADDSDDDVIVEDDDVEPSDDSDTESDSVNDERSDGDEPDATPEPKSYKAMAEELAQLRKSQQEFQQQQVLYQAELADATLRQLYGDRAPERAAVIAEMDRLGAAKPGSYQSHLQLAQEAYTNLVGPPNQANARKATQPTVPTKRTRNDQTVSPADAEDAILDALMEGRPIPDARRKPFRK